MRYSESFKLQAVRAPEEGHPSSGCAAKQAHGIRGAETVRRRAWHYGREHVTGRVIRVETPEEHDESRRLKERVRDLEPAMGDAALDLRLERAYAKLACRKAGKDVEEFKRRRMASCPRRNSGKRRSSHRRGGRVVPPGGNESVGVLSLPVKSRAED